MRGGVTPGGAILATEQLLAAWRAICTDGAVPEAPRVAVSRDEAMHAGDVTSGDLLTVVCRGALSRARSHGRPVAVRTPQCSPTLPPLACCVWRVFADCVDRLTERNPCEEACAARACLPAGDAVMVPRRRVCCRWLSVPVARVGGAALFPPPSRMERRVLWGPTIQYSVFCIRSGLSRTCDPSHGTASRCVASHL